MVDQLRAAVAEAVKRGKETNKNKVGEQIIIEIAGHRPGATGAVVGAGGIGGDGRELQILFKGLNCNHVVNK